VQSLEIVSRLLPEGRAGIKTHTIRWREREIVPGLMRYINADDPADTVVVRVTEVTTMPLYRVAEYLGQSEAWPHSVLLAGMQEHYPDIRIDCDVEVIKHSVP